jgi:hypothetical protein
MTIEKGVGAVGEVVSRQCQRTSWPCYRAWRANGNVRITVPPVYATRKRVTAYSQHPGMCEKVAFVSKMDRVPVLGSMIPNMVGLFRLEENIIKIKK